MSEFVLYNAPQSTCSQRVCFVLNAKSLAVEEHKLDLFSGEQLKPAYLAINPNGVVPALLHDGRAVLDSTVILEYLDETRPQGECFTPPGSSRACAYALDDALHRRGSRALGARALIQPGVSAAFPENE